MPSASPGKSTFSTSFSFGFRPCGRGPRPFCNVVLQRGQRAQDQLRTEPLPISMLEVGRVLHEKPFSKYDELGMGILHGA